MFFSHPSTVSSSLRERSEKRIMRKEEKGLKLIKWMNEFKFSIYFLIIKRIICSLFSSLSHQCCYPNTCSFPVTVSLILFVLSQIISRRHEVAPILLYGDSPNGSSPRVLIGVKTWKRKSQWLLHAVILKQYTLLCIVFMDYCFCHTVLNKSIGVHERQRKEGKMLGLSRILNQ